MDDNKPTGRLENWFVFADRQLWGDMYDDQRGRFENGKRVMTSSILSPLLRELKEGVYVTTNNSTYLLGKPRED
jgi:hypothetical protein